MGAPDSGAGPGRLRKNVLFNAAGGLANITGQIVALPLALAAVGAESYGSWAVWMALLQIVLVTDLGLGPALVQRLASEPGGTSHADLSRTALCAFLGWAALVGSTTLLVALPLAAAGTFGDHGTALVLVAVFGGLLPALVGRWGQARLYAAQLFGPDRAFQVLALVLRLGGLGAVLALDGGIVAVAVVEAVTFGLPGMLAVTLGGRYPGVATTGGGRASREALASLLHFGLRAFSLGLVLTAAVQLPVVIAGAVAGSTAATAFSAAVRVQGALRQAQSWLTEPLLPNIAAATDARVRQAMNRATLALLALTITAAAFVTAFAEPLVSLWLGEDLAGAAPLVLALAIATAIGSAHTAPQVVGNALGEPWVYLRPSIVALAAHLMGVTVGLHAAGLKGAAVGIVLAAAAVEAHYVVVTAHRFGTRVVRRIVSTAAILGTVCAVAAGAAFVVAGGMPDVLAVVLGGAVYGLLASAGGVMVWNRLMELSGNRA
ncbi:lipopolysaccharide biosynthesis protein [Blastococcus sp. SYSU D01042]